MNRGFFCLYKFRIQTNTFVGRRPTWFRRKSDILSIQVSPITKQKLESSYELTGSKYSHSFEYDPSIRNIVTGEKISVLNFANGVISTGKSRILAKKLDHHVMLFTAWDDEKYYSGTPGDYIAVREDDEHDIT